MDGIDVKWWHKTMSIHMTSRWFLWIISVTPISTWKHFPTSHEAMKFTKSLLGHGALGMFGVRFFAGTKCWSVIMSSIFRIRFQILADMGFDLIPQAGFFWRILKTIKKSKLVCSTLIFVIRIKDPVGSPPKKASKPRHGRPAECYAARLERLRRKPWDMNSEGLNPQSLSQTWDLMSQQYGNGASNFLMVPTLWSI